MTAADSDVASIETIRKHRNEIAHEMPYFLIETRNEKHVRVELFPEVLRLLKKINRWWFENIEIPANPDLVGKEITDTESFHELLLNYMIQIVSESHSSVGSAH